MKGIKIFLKLKLWIQILIPQVEDFKAELSLQIQVFKRTRLHYL